MFGEGLGFTSPTDFGSFISSTEFAKFEPLEHSFVATEFQPGGVFFLVLLRLGFEVEGWRV